MEHFHTVSPYSIQYYQIRGPTTIENFVNSIFIRENNFEQKIKKEINDEIQLKWILCNIELNNKTKDHGPLYVQVIKKAKLTENITWLKPSCKSNNWIYLSKKKQRETEYIYN